MADVELGMEDYLAMARRRLKVILVPLLVAPLAGLMASYVFSPKYTSQSMILVEGQKVPSNYVAPVITADFTERISGLQQRMLSASRLRPVIQSLGLAKGGEEEGKLMEEIRSNMSITPVITSISAATAGAGKKKTPSLTDEPLPGFYIGFTTKEPRKAQRICGALTNLMMNENLLSRADVAKSAANSSCHASVVRSSSARAFRSRFASRRTSASASEAAAAARWRSGIPEARVWIMAAPTSLPRFLAR